MFRNNAKGVFPLPAPQRNQRGFTLIEMMIALVILSVSILGMTSLSLTIMRSNNETEIRNAAVRLTTELAEDLGAMSIESVVSDTETRQMSLRGVNVPFDIDLDVTELTNDVKQVVITITYTSRGAVRTNSAVVYKHRAS